MFCRVREFYMNQRSYWLEIFSTDCQRAGVECIKKSDQSVHMRSSDKITPETKKIDSPKLWYFKEDRILDRIWEYWTIPPSTCWDYQVDICHFWPLWRYRLLFQTVKEFKYRLTSPGGKMRATILDTMSEKYSGLVHRRKSYSPDTEIRGVNRLFRKLKYEQSGIRLGAMGLRGWNLQSRFVRRSCTP